jgi:hypothetical protein
LRRYGGEEIRPRDLPSDREIREQIHAVVQADSEGNFPGTIGESAGMNRSVDRFRQFELLLLPLEAVKQHPEIHPEGDVLYHSLQVFELARNAIPYDEEFLLAALLHDVGKGIDPRDHVAAGLEALDGLITPRTAWLIERHADALALIDGTLGARARRRLESAESFDELMILADCDRQGRAVGMAVAEVAEVLAYLRELEENCEGRE